MRKQIMPQIRHSKHRGLPTMFHYHVAGQRHETANTQKDTHRSIPAIFGSRLRQTEIHTVSWPKLVPSVMFSVETSGTVHKVQIDVGERFLSYFRLNYFLPYNQNQKLFIYPIYIDNSTYNTTIKHSQNQHNTSQSIKQSVNIVH